ncbi:hypothetical protein B0H63DRAFT_537075 [Podospora didyma]|uniref:Uncharacterized protein n=1 Tax=Podospora didyma TaxID=330526 RepID=A0AAE0NX74_9PEZI|nr:hypothetical protein B0H63DRAFT_537075 [Podospora didyma]
MKASQICVWALELASRPTRGIGIILNELLGRSITGSRIEHVQHFQALMEDLPVPPNFVEHHGARSPTRKLAGMLAPHALTRRASEYPGQLPLNYLGNNEEKPALATKCRWALTRKFDRSFEDISGRVRAMENQHSFLHNHNICFESKKWQLIEVHTESRGTCLKQSAFPVSEELEELIEK